MGVLLGVPDAVTDEVPDFVGVTESVLVLVELTDGVTEGVRERVGLTDGEFEGVTDVVPERVRVGVNVEFNEEPLDGVPV